MAPTTPLRSGEATSPRRPEKSSEPYAAHLLSIIESVDDLSSWSDSLATAAPIWPDSYHLHPARANVLRGLPLPEHATVLELGARAGALTRHLGETSALVDALDVDPAMAAVAATRCADLASVQVRVGWIDAVPQEPTYDVIIAIDVLGEIADSGMTVTSFLDRCRDLLRTGGLIVLAVDNADGIGLLLGDRPPRLPLDGGRRATPLSVNDLTTAAGTARLESLTLEAFPDHRHTQLLFSYDQLARTAPALLSELPKFTNPPLVYPHIDPEAERRAWTAAIEHGSAQGQASSIVLLAGHHVPSVDDAAVFWSLGRAAAQSACNRIRSQGSEAVVVRGHAFASAPPLNAPLRLRPHTEPVVDGMSLVRVLAEEPNLSRAHDLLVAWSDLIDSSAADGADASWDLIPRNVVVLADGSMRAIDQEWQRDAADVELVRNRGLFWLAADLLDASPAPWWLIGSTVGDAAQYLRRLAGAEADPFWLETFIRTEAADAACVAPTTTSHSRSFHARKNLGALMFVSQSHGSQDTSPVEPKSDESLAALRTVLVDVSDENERLRERVKALELERRHVTLVHRDYVLGLNSELETLRERMVSTQQSLRRSRVKNTRLQEKIAEMRASSTWRIGRFVVTPLARLRGRSAK